jgi:glutamyl-tRNA reductase
MDQIGVVGLSYRHAGVEQLARFAVPRTELTARLPLLRSAVRAAEVLYLGTCNRVEVVYASPAGAAAADARPEIFRTLTGREPLPGEAARVLRAWTGEAAVEHLLLLACGLDSAQTGEQEIAAQLRAAWADARAAHTLGPVLDRLIGETLGMARRVRRLAAAVRAPSLADLAVDRVLSHLGGTRAAVALIGVSPMTRRCAAQLHAAGVPLVIVNRTAPAAEDLARTVGARTQPLEDFRARPPAVAAVVLAAGGGAALLEGATLARLAHASPLLIDFGVPPNVEPAAATRARLMRVGMSELIEVAQHRRVEQLMRLAPVRAAIDERLTQLRTELALRAFGAELADLRGAYEHIAAEEVARALANGLGTLDPRERARLEQFGRTLALRLAHLPLAGLRAAALHASGEAVDAFFDATRAARRPRARRTRETTGTPE